MKILNFNEYITENNIIKEENLIKEENNAIVKKGNFEVIDIRERTSIDDIKKEKLKTNEEIDIKCLLYVETTSMSVYKDADTNIEPLAIEKTITVIFVKKYNAYYQFIEGENQYYSEYLDSGSDSVRDSDFMNLELMKPGKTIITYYNQKELFDYEYNK